MIPIWEGMLDSGTGFSRLPRLMVLPMYTRSSCRGVLHVWEAFSDGLCCAALGPSVVSNSVTLWAVAHQAPLSMGIFQSRTLEWVAISFSRGSSWPRDGTRVSCISCIGRQFFTTTATWEVLYVHICIHMRIHASSLVRYILFVRYSLYQSVEMYGIFSCVCGLRGPIFSG